MPLFFVLIYVAVSLLQATDYLQITFKEILVKFVILLIVKGICIAVDLVTNFLTSFLLDTLDFSLSYYRQQFLFVGLYIINSIMAECLLMALFLEHYRGKFLPIQISVQFLLHSQALWVCLFSMFEFFSPKPSLLTIYCLIIYDISLGLILLTKGLRYAKILRFLYHGK